jgi:hypothetical protein
VGRSSHKGLLSKITNTINQKQRKLTKMKNQNSVPALVSSKMTVLDKKSVEFNELMDLYQQHNEEESNDIEADIEDLKRQFVSGVKHTFKFDNGDIRETISLNFLADTFTDETKTEKTAHYELFTLTGTCEEGMYMLHSQFSTCVLCLHPYDHDHNFDYNPN